MRLVERGLRRRPGGEHDDARVVDVLGRGLHEGRPHGLQERPHLVQAGVAVHLWQHARDHVPVLHGVPQPGRRLRPVGDDDPVAGWRAGDVGGGEQERAVVDGARPGRHAQVALVGVDHGRRDEALREDAARSVQVGEQCVQQLGALGEADLQGCPVLRAEHERQRVEPPP